MAHHHRNWAELPDLVIERILNLAGDDLDAANMRRVCWGWRLVVESFPPRRTTPWIVLCSQVLGLSQFPRVGCVRRPLPPNLPQKLENNLHAVSTSLGWILCGKSGEKQPLYLLNPITGGNLTLPSLEGLPWVSTNSDSQFGPVLHLHKISLSDDPTRAGARVMALAACADAAILCQCSPMDENWTGVTCWPRLPPLSDLIFYQGSFYAVALRGAFHIYTCTATATAFQRLDPSVPLFTDGDRHFGVRPFSRLDSHDGLYLAISSGKLLLVCIRPPHLPNTTCSDPGCPQACLLMRLELFQVILSPDASFQLAKLSSLDGACIFVGKGSAALSVQPDNTSLLRPNCIYIILTSDIPADNCIIEYYLPDGLVTPILGYSLPAMSPASKLLWLLPCLADL